MKARIPLPKEMQKIVNQEAQKEGKKEFEKQSKDFTRRIFKLMCYVLYNKYHFNDRCKDVIVEINKLTEKANKDEVFWEHIDRVVIDYLKIPFDRDYTR
jgi:hypothetical protein